MPTDEWKETKRAQTFSQSFEYGIKPRHGLFSMPVSTAIGDNTRFQPTKANRDPEDNKPITGPNNFGIRKGKTGHGEDVYFAKSSFIAVGDPFQAAALESMRNPINREIATKAGHDKDFKPARKVKERLYTTSFAHIDEKPHAKTDYRDPEGGVLIGPRNFLTNPMKEGVCGTKIGTSFGGIIPYMEDDYDVKKKILQKEQEYHNSKIQDKHFSQKAKAWGFFNSHKDIHMENPMIPARKLKVEEVPGLDKEGNPIHGRAFRCSNPAKKGNHCTIEKFPLYKEDPPKEVKRLKYEDGKEPEVPPGFRMTYNRKGSPTPSIACNIRNLKSSFPASFRSPGKF